MRIKLEIDRHHIDEQLRRFRNISAGLEPQELLKIFQKHAKLTVKAAKAKVPVREGTLKKSIGIKTGSKRYLRRGRVSLFIGPLFKNTSGKKPYHMALVEYGSSRSKPKPYMRPAWQETRNQVHRAIENDIIAKIRERQNR